MRIRNPKSDLSSLENAKDVFRKWTSVGCLYSNLVQLSHVHRNAFAKGTLHREGLAIEPVIGT